ncbi:MAG: 2-keto-4-pentenoate hydratase, partial [Proteobacteria bacterium]|nr:2-keto-4-pentenoate hydratase [Pseudomonadota bacterium]
MKLATLKKGGRDGTLAVVSRDLKVAVTVPGIAPTLQNALERWSEVSHHLQHVYDDLSDGEPQGDAFVFDAGMAAAPLPRAYQWLDG